MRTETHDDIIDIAEHDGGEIGEVFTDAVIGDPVLRKIVGADLFASVACSHLCEASRSELFVALRFFKSIDTGPEDSERFFPVLKLGSLILALDHDTGRDVYHPYRGFRFVDVLASGTTSSAHGYVEVLIADLHVELIDFRQDGDRHRAGVDTAFVFRCRDPLDTMDASLEFEFGVGAMTGYLHNHFLYPAFVIAGFRHNLHLESVFHRE